MADTIHRQQADIPNLRRSRLRRTAAVLSPLHQVASTDDYRIANMATQSPTCLLRCQQNSPIEPTIVRL
ncbi:hypothetical protein CDQ92_19790 [Sphingopyxis bauzanensis]|uniref:Uncharacterized protein n=1 Tax=Sphingopyxis bauzanensis TaxID=651663 RepID=A0A246JJE8_9SPHN|nr:hypothetical protein [Sphingopyxis bauzanensis]OWQ92731.1 hypothetical protein CDQ92_19790 [Sphingopyxis bauzanensis]GGJ60492.1 hypothetical protein GCM10011393_33480 [Sphingopyxis bauzanensis]